MSTPIGDLVAKLRLDISEFEKNSGKIQQEMGQMDQKTGSLASSLKSLGPMIGYAFSTAAVMAFGKELFNVQRSMQNLTLSFKEIAGGTVAAGKEFQYLRSLAKEAGQSFYDLADSYKGILAASKGTALEGQNTQKIFTAVTKAAATLGLTADATKGSLIAIQQMMSKGKVSAEELRQQLGERLPGAFGLMAEAVGVSTAQLDKMLQQGEVMAADVLPKFADVLTKRYSGAVSESTRAVNALSEAWKDFQNALAEGFFMDAAVKALDALTWAVKRLKEVAEIPESSYWDAVKKGKIDKKLQAVDETITMTPLPPPDFSMKPWSPSAGFQKQLADPFGGKENQLDYLAAQTKARLKLEEEADKKSEKLAEDNAKHLRERLLDSADMSVVGSLTIAEQDKWIAAWNKNVDQQWKEYVDTQEQIGQTALLYQEIRDSGAEKSLALRKSLEQDYLSTLKEGTIEYVTVASGILQGQYDEKKKLIDLMILDEEQKYIAMNRLDAWYNGEKKKLYEETDSKIVQLSEQAARAMEQNFSSFFFDLMTGKLSDLHSFASSVFNSLAKMAADYMAQLARTALFGDKSSGLAGLIPQAGQWLASKFLPMPTMSTTSALARVRHGGGKVDGSGPYRAVDPGLFINAPRLHNGLRSGEYPAILERGESVIPKGGGSAGMVVNIFEAPGTKATAKQSDDGMSLEVVVEQMEAAISGRMQRNLGLASFMDSRYRRQR